MSAHEEYITIIATSASQVMAQFKERGLASEGYAIAGKIGRHSVSVVDDDAATEVVASRDGLIAATFHRTVDD